MAAQEKGPAAADGEASLVDQAGALIAEGKPAQALIRYDAPKATGFAVCPPKVLDEDSRAKAWASRIRERWQDSVQAIIAIGELIHEAQKDLGHGRFVTMVRDDLPFDERTAQRLMKIAADPRLTKATHVSLLPPHWGTLYELTKLDDATFEARIADGTICPEMQRRDISVMRKAQERANRERVLGEVQCALPARKYGVILADPEWRFEPWSTSGMDRAAGNHYPTSATEVIAARDVPSIAADDCVLFLWATVPMLPQALLVMGAWGFAYKSNYCWGKDKAGTGYWGRQRHELLLIGTKGKIPCPAQGEQWETLQIAPRGRHSEKPEWAYEMIEAYFPTLPKIELNCRGVPRAGWSAWGNETAEPVAAPTGNSPGGAAPATAAVMPSDMPDIPDFLKVENRAVPLKQDTNKQVSRGSSLRVRDDGGDAHARDV